MKQSPINHTLWMDTDANTWNICQPMWDVKVNTIQPVLSVDVGHIYKVMLIMYRVMQNYTNKRKCG